MSSSSSKSKRALSDQIAIVTGAAHGIGLGVAQALTAAGVAVAAVDIDAATLDQAPLADSTTRIAFDATDNPRELLSRVRDSIGVPSILFNNIGVMDGRSFLDIPDQAVSDAITKNVLSQWFLAKRTAEQLIEVGSGGSIVFNLSLHSSRIRMCPDYSVSKAALLMLVKEMSFELGPFGIRVNAVSPGAVDTWSDRVPEPDEHRSRSEAMVPLGRLGSPEDVGSAVVFLADDEKSAYITGADLRIDGGLDQFNWLHHLYGSAAAERSRLAPEWPRLP